MNQIAQASKELVHFTAPYFLNPTNPLTVNLIGCGGTGSKVLTGLAQTHHSLRELNHPGLNVTVWDADTVNRPNLGRQLFATSELGLNKAVAYVNRINRFCGAQWKAKPLNYAWENRQELTAANLFITCVDTVNARFDIARLIRTMKKDKLSQVTKPFYWMDFGNSQQTGQVILSTIGSIQQPKSNLFSTRAELPFITDEFADLLRSSEEADTGPSCSLAEALDKQDLFINSTVANLGCGLLWSMFRTGYSATRGVFVNMAEFRTQPLRVS